MKKLLTTLLLACAAGGAMADTFKDADNAWKPGDPYPAHWLQVEPSAKAAWNVIVMGFVRKVYSESEIDETSVKAIPRDKIQAVVDVCRGQRGLARFRYVCDPAVVPPGSVTPEEGDFVLFLATKDDWGLYSTTDPGNKVSYARRLVQIVGKSTNEECWDTWPFPVLRMAATKECKDRYDLQNARAVLEWSLEADGLLKRSVPATDTEADAAKKDASASLSEAAAAQ